MNCLDIIVFSSFQSDEEKCLKYGIDFYNPKLTYLNIFKHLILALIINILITTGIKKCFFKNEFLDYISNANILLDISGDSFTDDYGITETMINCYYIIISRLLRTPVGIYSQSIGPFNHIITKMIAVYCLNRVDILIVREEITKNYLKKIGIKKEIYLSADPAFLLEPVSNSRIHDIFKIENFSPKNGNLIGFSVSQHINDLNNKKSENDYITKIAKIADYLTKKYDATIVFTPHVMNDKGKDDRYVAKEIYKLIEEKDRIILINNEYSARELKGIISYCNLFIGARMHANIAAISTNVPTLAISYSQKTPGIMKMLGLEEYVINFNEIDLQDTINKIDKIWDNKKMIKEHLSRQNGDIKKLAFKSATLVKERILDNTI